MIKNKKLRIGLSIIWVLSFIYENIVVIHGEASILVTTAFIGTYVLLILLLISLIIEVVVTRIVYYEKYKKFLEMYEHLKKVHKIRYKIYFSSNKQKIEEAMAEISTKIS